MKYNSNQLTRIKNKEIELQGEFQKAVWSIIRRDGEQKLKVISVKLGRGNDQVHSIIKRLIELNMVKKVSRGVYTVSDYIITGEVTKWYTMQS